MSCPKKRFDFGHVQDADSANAISDIFAKLSPFLNEQERSQFSQMQNMMQMLKLYQTFQELAPFMNMGGDAASPPDPCATGVGKTKDNAPNSNSPDQGGMSDMLFSMLSPEQKEMFENLKTVMSEPPAE